MQARGNTAVVEHFKRVILIECVTENKSNKSVVMVKHLAVIFAHIVVLMLHMGNHMPSPALLLMTGCHNS